MRVVISGSSGLIGRSVVAALRARGDEVTALVRRPPAVGEAQWDPTARSIDAGVVDGADGVVHLAGAGIGDKRWSAARRRRDRVEPGPGDHAPGSRSCRAAPSPRRARKRFCRRLLRGSRRRGAHRGELRGNRVPGRGVSRLGGRHGAGGPSRYPGRPASFGCRALVPRGGVGATAPTVPLRRRGQVGKRPTVVELDHARRRGRRHPLRARRAFGRGGGQCHCTRTRSPTVPSLEPWVRRCIDRRSLPSRALHSGWRWAPTSPRRWCSPASESSPPN